MPEPLHPPYNVTQPRLLQRWLDINSQNGPLTRIRGFISIPEFTIHNRLLFPPFVGERIFQLNFISQHNFSLVNTKELKSLIDFCDLNRLTCYIVSNFATTDINGCHLVSRYRVSSTPVDMVDADFYIGQQIKGKYFQIEIWDRGPLPTNTVTFPGTIIYTSILGDRDYRWGTDFCIHNQPVAQLFYADFQNISGGNGTAGWNLPIAFNLLTINGFN